MRRRGDMGLISGNYAWRRVEKNTRQFVAFLLIICHDDDTITYLRARGGSAGVTDSLIAVWQWSRGEGEGGSNGMEMKGNCLECKGVNGWNRIMKRVIFIYLNNVFTQLIN